MRRIERRAPLPSGRVLAFTGHRPSKYPYLEDETSAEYARLKRELSGRVDDALESGFTHFVCGGALGVDTLAALIVLEKAQTHPDVTLEIVAPCDEQDKYWPRRDKAVYRGILARADVVTWVSDVYTPFCMMKRNEYMVSLCEKLIAVYDGTKGGTYATVALALKKGVEIEIIRP